MFGLDNGEITTLVRLAAATADESNADADGGEYDRALQSFSDPDYVHRLAYTTWERIVADDNGATPAPTGVAVHEAAGRTLDELRASYSFDVVHEEDPGDPRPLVRVLRFPNLIQATDFLKLFDPGDHSGVWFTNPDEVTAPFDQRVCLSVTFIRAWRPTVDRLHTSANPPHRKDAT